MKIWVLRSALEDLASAREFYDGMESGVGDYFFDSLFSDINSSTLYAGIHAIHHGFHRMVAHRFFPMAFITESSSKMQPSSSGCWIAAGIRSPFAQSLKTANPCKERENQGLEVWMPQ